MGTVYLVSLHVINSLSHKDFCVAFSLFCPILNLLLKDLSESLFCILCQNRILNDNSIRNLASALLNNIRYHMLIAKKVFSKHPFHMRSWELRTWIMIAYLKHRCH